MSQVFSSTGHVFLHRILKDLDVHGILIPQNIADRSLHIVSTNRIPKKRLHVCHAQLGDLGFYLVDTDTLFS